MERTIVKLKIGEVWYQVRSQRTWWTIKFKIGSVDEIMDWALAQNATIEI